jgi:hypothetical protein
MDKNQTEVEVFFAQLQQTLGQQLFRILELEALLKTRNEELEALKNKDNK